MSFVEQLQGRSGWSRLSLLTIEALEPEQHLVFSAIDDDGDILHEETCERLFMIAGARSGMFLKMYKLYWMTNSKLQKQKLYRMSRNEIRHILKPRWISSKTGQKTLSKVLSGS